MFGLGVLVVSISDSALKGGGVGDLLIDILESSTLFSVLSMSDREKSVFCIDSKDLRRFVVCLGVLA